MNKESTKFVSNQLIADRGVTKNWKLTLKVSKNNIIPRRYQITTKKWQVYVFFVFLLRISKLGG